MYYQDNLFLNDKIFAEIYSDIRKSTLSEFVPVENDDENSALDKLKDLTESNFIKLMEKIYDKSLMAGHNIVINHGDTYTTEHIIAFLNKTDIPCLSSGWKLLEDDSTWRRFRTDCSNTVCSRRCTYWREAVKGLIEGLGENSRYARHRSLGHGDKICVDVIYDSENPGLKFGSVTDEIEEMIKPVRKKLAEYNFRIILDGFSENILYYRLIDRDLKPGNLRYNLAKDILIEQFREKQPAVILFEYNTYK